jgi:hypothetical protein
MGATCGAICKECGNKFQYSDGGGMFSYLLRCDKCGRDKSIGFYEIPEPLLRDHQEVEKLVGTCRCKGRYRFDAPARCPKCKSTDFADDPEFVTVYYD